MNDVTSEKASWIARASIIIAAWHNPAARALVVDVLVAVIARLSSWSMSGIVIFVVIWMGRLSMAPNLRKLLRQFERPACSAPIMLFVLALSDTLWSGESADFGLYAVGPATELLR